MNNRDEILKQQEDFFKKKAREYAIKDIITKTKHKDPDDPLGIIAFRKLIDPNYDHEEWKKKCREESK